jgi:hypothetical protein
MITLAISPTPPVSSQSCSEDWRWHGGFPRRLIKVLGVWSPRSAVSMMNGAWRLDIVLRYSDVSVSIHRYTLFNNIVFDTIHSVVVCVDFLDTHMVNLVLFLKLGVTTSYLHTPVQSLLRSFILLVKQTNVESN